MKNATLHTRYQYTDTGKRYEARLECAGHPMDGETLSADPPGDDKEVWKATMDSFKEAFDLGRDEYETKHHYEGTFLRDGTKAQRRVS